MSTGDEDAVVAAGATEKEPPGTDCMLIGVRLVSSFTALLGSTGVALNIASFLSIRDTLSLQGADKGWCNLIATHEESLFSRHLRADFPEGKILVKAVAEHGASYKRMYLAFRNRWKLHKHQSKRICIHWRRPYRHIPSESCGASSLVSADVDALVFIVRVGDNPESCGLMEWDPDPHDPMSDRLIMDEDFWDYGIDDDSDGGLEFHSLDKKVCRWINSWHQGVGDHGSSIHSAIRASYRLTLYAVDVRRCQVLTIMEDCPPEDVHLKRNLEDTIEMIGYGNTLPNLYGLPGRDSPFYRPLTENDYHNLEVGFENYRYGHVEYLCLMGGLELTQFLGFDHDDVVYADGRDSIHFSFDFDFATVTRRAEICGYFRALMKEKCLGVWVESTSSEAVFPVVRQPAWVQNDTILDAILSFAPFELQASRLREVSRHFKISATRQLEIKFLDETKVIGFEISEFGWFKADLRRGWSEDRFATTKDSVIDDALWMASCRCPLFVKKERCEDKDSCPGMKEVLKLGRKETTLDMDQARVLLNEKGQVTLTQKFADGQENRLKSCDQRMKIRYEEGNMSLFGAVYKGVDQAIASEVSYEMLPESFQRSYGLSGDMTLRRFLRSLFIIFSAKATPSTAIEEESRIKRACLPKPSIGMAQSFVERGGIRDIRMKMLFRFYTFSKEPIEIRLESRHSIDLC